MEKAFKALYVTNSGDSFQSNVQQVNFDQLDDNPVLVRVEYSSLNYKDALSASGNKGVTRKFPHIPGIDAAGTIKKSSNPSLPVGRKVLVTGYDLGMNTWGGFGEYISVPAEWVVPLPAGLSALEAMSFGTAGFTAGLSIEKIVNAGIDPDHGSIVVSGATGGVGSMAVAVLEHLGYQVTAVSGKTTSTFLMDTLHVKQVLDRVSFVEKYDSKPLASADFSAGVDNVGGAILSAMLKSVKHNGVVTSCGNVASASLNTSVFPFILRGVTLSGIDSAQADMALRNKIWNLLASDWKPANLSQLITVITLQQLPEKLNELLAGKAQGRYVLRHD
jgi:acrylyl-CoA reductase (NADPH)